MEDIMPAAKYVLAVSVGSNYQVPVEVRPEHLGFVGW